MSEWHDNDAQDSDPPEAELVVEAALRLREIIRSHDRSKAEQRRAVDALGRALLRLKRALTDD